MRWLVLALAIPAAVPAQEGDAALRAAAERYVASEGVQRSIEAGLSAELVVAALDAQLGERLSGAERDEIADVVSEELTAVRPAMEAAMAEAAAATFTLDEIEALTAFYGSPEGAAILTKMPAYTTSYLAAVGPDLRAATERAMARAAEAAVPPP